MSVVINPKYNDSRAIIFFKQWVKKNYIGKEVEEYPKGVDYSKYFIIEIDGLYFGPIPYNKVPKKVPDNFKAEIEFKTFFDL